MSYCCNKGNVTGEHVNGGIVGNNRGKIQYVYNIANQIKSTRMESGGGNAGGIAGNNNPPEYEISIQYAYNTSKIVANDYSGGIVGGFYAGTVDYTYNMGKFDTVTNKAVGEIKGDGKLTPTNSKPVTETEMKGWNQDTINTNLQNFIKKENSLPILNITVRNVTF